MREPDAIVIGGAGRPAATATWLARAGHRVVLYERERFPRFHVGESLVPGVNDLLAELGVWDRVDRAGFQVKRGGNLTSPGGTYVKFHLSLIEDQLWKPYTFQVLRSTFDQILLDHSREHGVEVHEGTQVLDLCSEGSRVVGARAGAEGGPAREIKAPIVVDASGRDTFVASKFRLRRKDPVLNKVSIWGHFDGVAREPGPDEGNLVAAVFDKGWFWIIPLAGGTTSVGAVVDGAEMRGTAKPEDLFWQYVERSPFVSGQMRRAVQVSPLYVVSNLAYRATRFSGEGYVLAGDAAIFLDPIYSYGVYLALKTGKIVADRIHDGFATGADLGPELFRPYEESVRREVEVVFGQIYHWYRFIGDTARVDRFLPLMIRWVSLRRSFSLLFSGRYAELDPGGPSAMVQMLKNPLTR